MFKILVFLLSWQVFAANESDQIIQYSSPQRMYRMVLSPRNLSFQGRPQPFVIPITDCNRQMVTEFWRIAVSKIQQLPTIADENAPLQPRMKLNQKIHWLAPMMPASKRVRFLNQELMTLLLEEQRKCGKS